MYFPAGVNEASYNVTIRDDGLIEPDEEFYIGLEIPSSVTNRCVTKHSPGVTNCKCKHDNTTVIIIDDDSE